MQKSLRLYLPFPTLRPKFKTVDDKGYIWGTGLLGFLPSVYIYIAALFEILH